MRVSTLVEFVDAAVDTKWVTGPYDERGGVMISGYAGSFKTTIVRAAMDHHSDSLVISDLNVHQWIKIREDFITGRYSSMGFVDFEKIYQRHNSTSSHIEGIIKGLVAEGYGTGPAGDQRMPSPLARALVVGALTSSCLERKYSEWNDSGFLRRFLWLVITVKNINEVAAAIKRWEKIDFGKVTIKPANKTIPMSLSAHRENQLQKMMKEQPGFNGIGYITLKKICAVLEWKYGSINGAGDRVGEILREIEPALSKEGGKIDL